jgi:hypothetical protein
VEEKREGSQDADRRGHVARREHLKRRSLISCCCMLELTACSQIIDDASEIRVSYVYVLVFSRCILWKKMQLGETTLQKSMLLILSLLTTS